MTGKKLLDDAAHWRARGEEARVRAEQIPDPEARRKMLEVAAEYERMAEQAEQRSREGGKG